MEECIHRKLGFSTWVKVPPIVGKLRTCWQCGAVKAGSNTVTLAGNYIDMTSASAPDNPDSGMNRIYSTDGTTLSLRDNSGNVTGLTVGSGNFVFEGSQTGGGSTDSTSGDNVLGTVSSLSIVASKAIYVFASFKITKTSAGNGNMGIKLNSTQVIAAHGESKMTSSFNDTSSSGAVYCYIPPRVTNYLQSIGGRFGAGEGQAEGFYKPATNMPTATITDISLTAYATGGCSEVVIDEIFVYSLATS